MTDPPASPPPLPTSMSAGDQARLARAAALHRPLARAAKLASANGLGYVIFGGLSLVLALPGLDVIGLLLGAILLAVGFFERSQAVRLRHAELTAPVLLMRAELALLAAIGLYGVAGLTWLPSAGAALEQQLHGTHGLGIDVRKLADSVNQLWYATVIGIAVLYQGGMARYFHRRRRDVASYLAEVPAWARTVVEALAG